jgi:hypothetical protein
VHFVPLSSQLRPLAPRRGHQRSCSPASPKTEEVDDMSEQTEAMLIKAAKAAAIAAIAVILEATLDVQLA